ncbi:MAG: sulfotransferase [Pseudomonadota bacterium]
MGFATTAMDAATKAMCIRDDWKTKLALAKCCAAAGKLNKALQIVEQLVSERSKTREFSAAQNSEIAGIFAKSGRLDRALEFAKSASSIVDFNEKHSIQYAECLQALGMTDCAAAELDRLLQRKPENWLAYRMRAETRPWSPTNNHIEELTEICERDLAPNAVSQITSALGKELNDCGDCDAAFNAYVRSADALNRIYSHNVESDLRQLAHLKESYSSVPRQHSELHAGLQPIFIIGLPGSGVLFLEHLLSQHSHICACGALPDLGVCLEEHAKQSHRSFDFRRDVITKQHLQVEQKLGRSYLISVSNRFDISRQFTDRSRANALRVGFLLRALPSAKFLIMNRNLSDHGYALFQSYFDREFLFSNSLSNIGKFLPAFGTLMDHWASLGGRRRVRRVRLEELINHPRQVLSGIYDFLELPIKEHFGDREDQILESKLWSSNSSTLHSKSVGCSAPVIAHLNPMLEGLQSKKPN